MLCQECKPNKRDDAYVLLIGRAEIESKVIHTKVHAGSLAEGMDNYSSPVKPDRARPSVIARFKELQ